MIHRHDDDGIALLRLEHGKANAIDVELFESLEARLDELETRPARAVVITGTGAIFSAGVDLFRVIREGRPYLERFLPLLSRGLRRLFSWPGPVVAAVNGHAIAGGCILAAACDRRVMTDAAEATIGIPELRVGVPFPVVPLEVMRHLLPSRVQDLVTTGRTVGPAEALALGLADELATADEVVGRAMAVARRFATVDPDAWALNKGMLRRPALERMDRDASDFDPAALEIWRRPESAERIRAYLETAIGKR